MQIYEGLIRYWAHIVESKEIEEGIGTATDRDGNPVKTINGDSNEEQVARSAAAGVMWLVKDCYDNGPSRGKDDGRTAEFDLSFGPYENVGHVRFDLHGHYLFSAIDELVQYPNRDEWEDNVDRFSNEFRNKVRLVGPNDDVVVMKGTYSVRLGCGIDMTVELTKEFRTGDENSSEHKDKVKNARDEGRYSKPDLP